MENARAIKEQLDVSTILGTVKSTVDINYLLHVVIDIYYARYISDLYYENIQKIL